MNQANYIILARNADHLFLKMLYLIRIGHFLLEMPMKVAVVGSRNFTDYDLMKKVLDNIKIDIIISGGALGADYLAEQYAKENNLEMIIHKPNWHKHGKAAGYIRNVDIVNDAEMVIAFWDGKSRGTHHTINITRKSGKFCSIINYKEV
jgi:hypothetical protein